MPRGVLFRDEEREMRERIIAADLIEVVIGLGPNLFYNSPMEACIVVCRSQKRPEQVGQVLFIDAVNEVTRERAQSFLTPANIARIVGAYRSFGPEPGFAASAPLAAITSNGSNLSIRLYVKRKVSTSDNVDIPEAMRAWRENSADLQVAAADLFELLVGEGAEP